MKIYFIFDGNKHEGPFSIEELQAKGIKRDTFVWKEGLPDWVHADKVEELDYILPPPVVAEVPHPPAHPPPDPVVETTAAAAEEIKASEKKDITEEKVKETEPVKPIVSETKAAKEIKETQPKPAKEKISIAEEKAPVKKEKVAEPKKPILAGTVPKKKRSNVLAFVIILVILGGGGAGYYLYTQNQKGKMNAQTNRNILEPDTTAGIVGNSQDSIITTGEETTGIETETETNPGDKIVVTTDKTKDKTKAENTDSKTTKTDETKKTDTKTDGKKDKVEKTDTEDPKDKVEEKTVNPLQNLSVTGSYKKNLLGEGVIEGKLKNDNSDVQFSKVVIEASFLSSTGAVLRSEQFTKSGSLKANNNLSFKFRTNPTKDVKNVSFRVVSAQ